MDNEKTIEILLDTVLERDIDLLIIEEFISVPEFASILLAPLGICSEYTVETVIHSKRDSDLGESDIVFILNIDGRKHAIHIENKIDAQAMPDQHDRYVKRIEKDINAGEYDSASWMLVAPEKYIAENSEAKKYEYKVTYEQLYDYFKTKDGVRTQYKRALINRAITDQKNGYQWQSNPSVEDFCNRMNKYQAANYPRLPVGTIAWWPHRKTPLHNVQLVWKPNMGYCDLTFSRMTTEELTAIVYEFLSDNMLVVATGKSASVRIYVACFSLREPFSERLDDVNEALDALQKLYNLSLKLAAKTSIAAK